MLIQQTFALFVFRADRRLGLGIFKGYETNRIQKKRGTAIYVLIYILKTRK